MQVTSRRTFTALDHHNTDSRPDLVIEVYRPSEDSVEDGTVADLVMIESKVGSREGQEQPRRYAEHLDRLAGFANKALVYITRGHDPKETGEVLVGTDGGVRFAQLRWHSFYRFLRKQEKDTLVEEVMTFMEEQGMARSYRFSAADLVLLSRVSRAFEMLDETLGGEVRAEQESFAGNKARREIQGVNEVRWHRRYLTRASLHGLDLFCDVGYQMGKVG